ncbi:MAG: YciI family protein [Staphylococcus rostri]|uniref:YciI family protein n=1 Tax=Staphylococcus rostri TaxID=522262 RepID=UPI0026DEAF87|nr:YciI family protein [Staphylococcus rostri]MDO5376207.1 YciI family protein [Staphylococcus rostri]
MFLITITIKSNQVPSDQADDLLTKHRAWFKEQFDKGYFKIIGPLKDRGMAGIVIAKVDTRDELDTLIAKDAYYPDYATYDVVEFKANLVATDIAED